MFNRTKAVLRNTLPKTGYDFLYNVAWRVYLAWQDFSDCCHFRFQWLQARLSGNRDRAAQMKIMSTVKPYTMVGRSGLYVTYESAAKAEHQKLAGSFVECGVARGGCAALMALVARYFGSRRDLWLFDTFQGLPAPTTEDNHVEPIYTSTDKRASLVSEGYCLGTQQEVERLLFSKLRLPREKIHLVKGLFQDTLVRHREKTGPIAVLRLDGDWYESTRCCLENLYDNVVSGGYIILDDYVSVPGCRKATDEFLAARGIETSIRLDDRGGAYFVKP